MIGHFKTALFTHRLYLADQLTDITLLLKLGSYLTVKYDRKTFIRLGVVSSAGRSGYEHILFGKAYRLAVHIEVIGAAAPDRSYRFVRMSGELCAYSAEQFTVLGSYCLELRLYFISNVLFSAVRKLYLLDVELAFKYFGKFLVKRVRIRSAEYQTGKRLTVLYHRRIARSTSEICRREHQLHTALKLLVHSRHIRYRIIAQMYGYRSIGIYALHYIAVYALAHERDKRSRKTRKRFKNGVQRHVRSLLVLRHTAAPVPFTATAHIPVRQFVRKLLYLAGRLCYAVLIKALVNISDKRIQSGEHPLIHKRQFAVLKLILARVEFIYLCIQHIKSVCVPERSEELSLNFTDRLSVKPRREPRIGYRIEIPAHGVRSLFAEYLERIDDVAEMFALLYSVLVKDVTENYAVLERRSAEHKRGHRFKSIEPAAGLVYGFTDEIRRERLIEQIFVFKRIVILRERHRAGIVPAVDNFGSAVHSTAARTLPRDFIHIRLMKLYVLFESAFFTQLFTAAYCFHLAALVAYPYRKRSSPVPFTRKSPVNDVLKEIAHTSGAYSGRYPVYRIVISNKLVAQRRHLDEPARTRVVQKRRVTTPAERVAVHELETRLKQSALFKIAHYGRIGFLAEHAGEFSAAVYKLTVRSYHLHERQIVFPAHLAVVLTERGRYVNYSGTVCKRYVIVAGYIVCLLSALEFVEVEKRLILGVLVLRALLNAYRIVRSEMFVYERSRKNIMLSVTLDLTVILVRVHTKRNIGRKRPRRCGPCEYISIISALYLETRGA